MTDHKVTQRKITDYTPDPHNANQGTERGLRELDNSIAQDGMGRSIVSDSNGVIPAGNKTLERAADLGIKNVIEIETEGDVLIVHKRRDWNLLDSDPNNPARRYAYRDNRVAELDLSWSPETVFADLQAGFDFDGMFQPDELNEIVSPLLDEEVQPDVGAQIDRAEELREKWQTERGQLWVIPSAHGGEHRLLCGDSTDGGDVGWLVTGERCHMVLADPPYGVDYRRGKYDGTDRKGNMPKTIQNDHLKGEDQQKFICDVFSTMREFIQPNGVIYMWSATLQSGAHSMFGLIDADVHIQSQLIWNKSHFVLGQSDYHWSHEICWYGYWSGAGRVWNGERTKKTVIDGKKIPATLHPNEKPVEVYQQFLENSSHPTMSVYDPFGGSGTTMVACEQLGRQCRMMEIEPKYVAVILERMSGMGLEPRLSGE